MYVVEYGGELYGPFPSHQHAALWKPASNHPMANMHPSAFRVREVRPLQSAEDCGALDPPIGSGRLAPPESPFMGLGRLGPPPEDS